MRLHYDYWLIRAIVTSGSILFMVAAANATCTNIYSCETVSTSGTYCLQPNATLHSSGGDCLVISAPNVTLTNAGGTPNSITGVGTFAGLHVLSSASHFKAFFFCLNIDGFNSAVRNDANGAIFDNDNDCPLTTGTHVNYGIYFNHVTGSQYIGGSGDVQGRIFGLWISGGSNNYISSDAPDIDKQGFRGGTDGVHIDNGSTGNVLYGIAVFASQNGIHLLAGTSQNFIYLNGASQNSAGIKVDQNSIRNFVIHNAASNNNADDVVDLNTNCDQNVWAENSFVRNNQACID